MKETGLSEEEMDVLFETVELALASLHGTVATDLPDEPEAVALLERKKAWRVDHARELEALRKIRRCFSKLQKG